MHASPAYTSMSTCELHEIWCILEQVAPQVQDLAQGGIDAPGFLAAAKQSSPQQDAQPQASNAPPAQSILPGSRAVASSPPALNTSSQANSSQKHHGLSGGAIAGIVIGCVAGVALLAVLALLAARVTGHTSGSSPHQVRHFQFACNVASHCDV